MTVISKTFELGTRLLKIAFRNPKRLRHVFGTALAAADQVLDPTVDLLEVPEVGIEAILPDRNTLETVTLALFPQIHASVSYAEYFCLAALLKKVQAKRAFEFGTYKGVSITQIALNVLNDGDVLTLDLPEGNTESLLPITAEGDLEIACHSGKGSLVPESLRHRIQFLRNDSARFDESPFANSIDFVFVDGAHNADYVENDSKKGWRMLRRGGVIVWHDCCVNAPDVIRFLIRCPYRARRISETALAFAIKDD